jgi:hypothetical protein
MGLDPELVAVLRRDKDGAAAELAAIPDTPELSASDEEILRLENSNEGSNGKDEFTEINGMAERFRSGELQLNPEIASIAGVMAFCLAIEMKADEIRTSRLGTNVRS